MSVRLCLVLIIIVLSAMFEFILVMSEHTQICTEYSWHNSPRNVIRKFVEILVLIDRLK
jgi:hypothetical protein